MGGGAAADDRLVAALAEQAGLARPWTAAPLGTAGLLNRHYLLRPAEGEPVVARVYGWPFPVPEPGDRAAKEAWVLRCLARVGAPAPRLLAHARLDDGGRALLTTYHRGVLLGELSAGADAVGSGAADVVGAGGTAGSTGAPGAAVRGAWAAAARALADAHAAPLDGAPAGEPDGGGVVPYPGGWAGHVLADLRHQGGRLASAQQELASPLTRATALAAEAAPILASRPTTLVHGDAHPWNILVAPAPGSAPAPPGPASAPALLPVSGTTSAPAPAPAPASGTGPPPVPDFAFGSAEWVCTALLDWEFAFVGDPLFDLVRLAVARPLAYGPPPIDLFAHPRHRTPDARFAAALYELLYHVWMANDARHHAHRPAYDNAARYLARLPAHVAALESLLAAAATR